MKKSMKRGLSPVIATVMLIVLALVLVMIVFTWARSWIGEKIEKDLGNGPEAIESFCKDVDFMAEVYLEPPSSIKVNNLGNIPLYGIEVMQKSKGAIENIGGARFSSDVLPKGGGQEVEVSFPSILEGDELIVLPVLLGESSEYKKAYTCGEEFGKLADIVSI